MGNKYSMHIGINTCGKGLYLHHLGPVLVNNGATLGEDCDIHFQVVVGLVNKSFSRQGAKVAGVPAKEIG